MGYSIELLISFVITLFIYVFPIVIIRFAILKKNVTRSTALKIVCSVGVVTFIISQAIIVYLGGEVGSGAAFVTWSFFNYYMLIGFNKENRIPEMQKNLGITKSYVKKNLKRIYTEARQTCNFYENCFGEIWEASERILAEPAFAKMKSNNPSNFIYLLMEQAINNIIDSGEHSHFTGKLDITGQNLTSILNYLASYTGKATTDNPKTETRSHENSLENVETKQRPKVSTTVQTKSVNYNQSKSPFIMAFPSWISFVCIIVLTIVVVIQGIKIIEINDSLNSTQAKLRDMSYDINELDEDNDTILYMLDDILSIFNR